jgi:hypothetical protein
MNVLKAVIVKNIEQWLIVNGTCLVVVSQARRSKSVKRCSKRRVLVVIGVGYDGDANVWLLLGVLHDP